MNQSRQALGRWGEKLAGDYLEGKGYSIIARNERTPYGEIDIIAQNDRITMDDDDSSTQVTIFVEVKTRTTQSFGYPEDSITPKKQSNIISAATHYLQEHAQLDVDWRIDVIAIERYPQKQPIIHHFEDAFR